MAVIMDKRFGYQVGGATETPLLGAIIGMPNEIDEHLAKIDLPPKVSRFLSYFRRASWGWAGAYQARGYEQPGTWCDYDAKECQAMTGLTSDQIEQARRWAVEAGIATYAPTAHRRGHGRLSWNLTFSEWKPLQPAAPRWGGSRKGAGRPKKQPPEETNLNPEIQMNLTSGHPLDTKFILIPNQATTSINTHDQTIASGVPGNQDESETFQDESEMVQTGIQDESEKISGASLGVASEGFVIITYKNNENNTDAYASVAPHGTQAVTQSTSSNSQLSHLPAQKGTEEARTEARDVSVPSAVGVPNGAHPSMLPAFSEDQPFSRSSQADSAPKPSPLPQPTIQATSGHTPTHTLWETSPGLAESLKTGKQKRHYADPTLAKARRRDWLKAVPDLLPAFPLRDEIVAFCRLETQAISNGLWLEVHGIANDLLARGITPAHFAIFTTIWYEEWRWRAPAFRKLPEHLAVLLPAYAQRGSGGCEGNPKSGECDAPPVERLPAQEASLTVWGDDQGAEELCKVEADEGATALSALGQRLVQQVARSCSEWERGPQVQSLLALWALMKQDVQEQLNARRRTYLAGGLAGLVPACDPDHPRELLLLCPGASQVHLNTLQLLSELETAREVCARQYFTSTRLVHIPAPLLPPALRKQVFGSGACQAALSVL